MGLLGGTLIFVQGASPRRASEPSCGTAIISTLPWYSAKPGFHCV